MIDSKIFNSESGKYRNFSVAINNTEIMYGRIYVDLPESYVHYNDEVGTTYMINVSTARLGDFLAGRINKDVFCSYVMGKYEDVQEYIRSHNCGTVEYESEDFEKWFWENVN